MMGVRRYSRFDRKREERADHLAQECNSGFGVVTIGDLIDAGFVRAEWRCRHPWCFHWSKPFPLSRYGRKARPYRLRWQYICSDCGTKGPKLHPLWPDY
jgi:hypothetical protein